MKYSCGLVQDLLPLFHDGVCSEESRKIVEKHLTECPACREYRDSLCDAENTVIAPPDAGEELKKAASFRAVRRKLRKKQALTVLVSLAVLAAAAVCAAGILKRSVGIIPYSRDISVSMAAGNLVGRLQGSQADYIREKRVEVTSGTEKKTCLFFYMSESKWDELTTGDHVFSEYVLCPAGKGAGEIDAVYYFTGNYDGLESLDEEELQTVIDHSVLLWSR